MYVEDDGRFRQDHRPGKELVGQGKYLLASEILNSCSFREGLQNMPARWVGCGRYEQLGYRPRAPSWRNTFLQGAFELRMAYPACGVRSSVPDACGRCDRTVARLPRISMDRRGRGVCASLQPVTPDTARSTQSSSAMRRLTTIKGFLAPQARPDLSTVNRHGPQPE